MILTRIIIFRATLFSFQHASRQFHHSKHLKISKILANPQNRNPHAMRSVDETRRQIDQRRRGYRNFALLAKNIPALLVMVV